MRWSDDPLAKEWELGMEHLYALHTEQTIIPDMISCVSKRTFED